MTVLWLTNAFFSLKVLVEKNIYVQDGLAQLFWKTWGSIKKFSFVGVKFKMVSKAQFTLDVKVGIEWKFVTHI